MRKTVTVDLGDRSYDVTVGPGVLGELAPALEAMGHVSSVVVITETTVSELLGPRVMHLVKGCGAPAGYAAFPAGEVNKTLGTYHDLMDQVFAVTPPIDRNTVIVALGGGVPGDVAGFVAATALRGLRWVQCPTTLLAGVDASVGGKTAVDHPAGKNLIGAFHQPRAVVIDVETLASLPAEEMGNGLAECVKHGVIRDTKLLEFIDASSRDILARHEGALTELIARKVAIKGAVVSADEREAGQRAHLNFGHTIGHAIELFAGYDQMPHGQAVSLGMVAACHMAARRKMIPQADADAVSNLLTKLGLPTQHADLIGGELWSIMQRDKKTRGGQVRMVLPTRLGEVTIVDDVTAEEVADAVSALRG